MKKIFAVLALLGLPACLGSTTVVGGDPGAGGGGGGGGDDMELTPDTPNAFVTTSMNAILSGARTNGFDLEYEPTVGRVAQEHANKMFERDFVSIFDPGTDNGMGGERDMGDALVDRGLLWDEIIQMVARGDLSVQEVYDGWETGGSTNDGSSATDLEGALDLEEYEYFGLGKAGSGDDQYWALLLVDPS
jgi:hypothetical protein